MNGMTQSTSTPSASISSALRPGSVRIAGCEPGRTTSAGCGSNVTTTEATPSSRARCTVWPMICWCPRWTPSKTPMVTTDRPHPAGAASTPRHRCIAQLLRPPAVPRPGAEDRPRPAPGRRARTRSPAPARPGRTPRTARTGRSAASGPPCESTRASSASDVAAAAAGARPRRRSGERHRIVALGQLVQRGGLGQGEAAHRGAAQRGQVAADAQRGAEVARDGPHVRAGRAVTSTSTSSTSAAPAAHREHVEPVDA